MSFVDTPRKRQKHPHYEHRTIKLDLKDNEFSSKKFQHVRKVSTHKKILKAFGRIALCLNNKPVSTLPQGDYAKVCFIVINDYDDKKNNKLGVGPLNDGYLMGLKHHRFGFKVFYLYNGEDIEFANYLAFFMKNTRKALTVFYTGRTTNKESGISFPNTCIMKETIVKIVTSSYNGKARVVFITDSLGSGSVFNVNAIPAKNMISFYVEKTVKPETKEGRLSHGLFTYYFCKITSDCPNITPNRLIERMNPSLKRFGITFKCENSDSDLNEKPIFFN
ncbi:hypothetical protein M9Y10_039177 [Tritrichomonas musculus]|uniref:Uncharacterized protein n=1 Tax=Tritrichomonas musculus TaxID=1915356 RepID=A0ABR2KAI2_9EUKA